MIGFTGNVRIRPAKSWLKRKYLVLELQYAYDDIWPLTNDKETINNAIRAISKKFFKAGIECEKEYNIRNGTPGVPNPTEY